MNCWKLLLILTICICGVYYLLAYQDKPSLTVVEKQKYRRNRYIGIALIVVSIGIGAYFYYNSQAVKASMPGECDTCKIYINRHRDLRPYKPEEYAALGQHLEACTNCSRQCEDMANLLQKDPRVKPADLRVYKNSCAEITKNAIYASNEYKRLGNRLRAGGVKAWETAHRVGAQPVWNPFPK